MRYFGLCHEQQHHNYIHIAIIQVICRLTGPYLAKETSYHRGVFTSNLDFCFESTLYSIIANSKAICEKTSF